MIKVGARLVRRYLGLCGTLYAIQLGVAGLAGWVVTRILATAFATRPLFDDAVDGDVVAFMGIMREQVMVLQAVGWVGVATVMFYMALSWFLIGGLNATLLAQPEGRREVASIFGAGAATTFFGYVRLALVGVVPSMIAIGVLLIGASRVGGRMEHVMTLKDLIGLAGPSLAPGLALLWLHWTAVDYARIELSRVPSTASWRALVRGYGTVLKDWRPLAHTGLYGAVFGLVSMGLVLGLHGRDMAGAGGAVLVFVIRQVVAIARFAAKMVCAGGQMVYAQERTLARAGEVAAARAGEEATDTSGQAVA